MKTIKFIVLLMSLACFTVHVNAQDTTTVKLDDNAKELLAKLEKRLVDIEKEERDNLKEIIAKLNEQQADEQIYSQEDFQALKVKYAERTAENIKIRQAIVNSQIDFLKANGYLADDLKNLDKQSTAQGEKDILIKIEEGDDVERVTVMGIEIQTEPEVKITRIKRKKITESDMFIAFGLNNVIVDGGGINDSPIKIGGSRFFEIGYQFSTRLREDNFLRLNYAFSFQFNGLKPDDNQYFVDKGNGTTELQDFKVQDEVINPKKSKFRQDNLIFPVHLQFNTSKRGFTSESKYYSDRFNFGLGGFVGLNLNNIQKMKYDFMGDSEKDKLKGSYNTNNFLYGLSAYAGFGDLTLYMTYNLNPLFRDNPVEWRNVQLGLRWVL